MLTFIVRRDAAAALFALALVASSHSAANADWAITGSCIGGWGMRNCVVNQYDTLRDPHVRPVRTLDDQPISKESIARDRKWLAFCKPVIVKDRYGVERYHYARTGCEFGRAE